MKFVKITGLCVCFILLVSGCVTKRVFEQEMQVRDERIASLETELEQNESRMDLHEQKLTELSQATKDAMDRATQAGELAKGKFLYEIVLSDDSCKFGINQIELGDQCKALLDEFVAKLKAENKNVYIEIQGHTDASGDEDTNYLVGKKRAEAVYTYLATHAQIPLHRMNVVSYGETNPIADNSTLEGRITNRRVVIVVLE